MHGSLTVNGRTVIVHVGDGEANATVDGTHFTLLDISGMALILAGVIIVSLKDLISLKRSSNHERQRLRQRSGH